MRPADHEITKLQHLEMFRLLPAWTMFVDPGETCGLALRYEAQRVAKYDDYSEHYGTLTLATDDAIDAFEVFIRDAWRLYNVRVTLVIEEYRIYPDKAQAHIGKTLPTAEAIGAFKCLARMGDAKVVEQPAYVKETTAALLKGRGIKSIGGSRHAKDAEIHMWYYSLRDQIDAARQKGKK